MTSTLDNTASAESVGATTASGGIRRLNPADGLFLRSEHLDQIQAYARELALAGGMAGGTGVAYGFQATLDGAKLHVAPGLAVDPSGRPLRTRETITLDLKDLAVLPGRFWVVEIASDAPKPEGDEPVYGELCADPCASGRIRPWLDDAVTVRVRSDDTLPALAAVQTDDRRRNWLASAYFEAERRGGGPWLTPGAEGKVGRLLDRPWEQPAPATAPGSAAVPLAVVLRVGDAWVLDVWTARRDLIAQPASAGWDWRLGWRPMSAFLAQVLQFEAQLAAAPFAESLGTETIAGADEFFAVVLKKVPRSKKATQKAWDDWLAQRKPLLVEGSLVARGFAELPPAGFLPAPAGQGELRTRLEEVFGSGVAVRLRHASADACLRAVRQAQHLDRIPLLGAASPVAVEVWVPDVPADLPALRADSYGWVAFARDRNPVDVVVPPDQVWVHVIAVPYGDDDGQAILDAVADQLNKRGADEDPVTDPLKDPLDYDPKHVAVLQYPAGQWAVPATPEEHRKILEALGKWTQGDQARLLGAVASATPITGATRARRPLAAARGSLLALEFASGIEARLMPTHVVPALDHEAIWLVVRVGLGE